MFGVVLPAFSGLVLWVAAVCLWLWVLALVLARSRCVGVCCLPLSLCVCVCAAPLSLCVCVWCVFVCFFCVFVFFFFPFAVLVLCLFLLDLSCLITGPLRLLVVVCSSLHCDTSISYEHSPCVYVLLRSSVSLSRS